MTDLVTRYFESRTSYLVALTADAVRWDRDVLVEAVRAAQRGAKPILTPRKAANGQARAQGPGFGAPLALTGVFCNVRGVACAQPGICRLFRCQVIA